MGFMTPSHHLLNICFKAVFRGAEIIYFPSPYLEVADLLVGIVQVILKVLLLIIQLAFIGT